MSVAARVGRLCGSEVVASRPVAGGDICTAWRMPLADGRTVFAKQAPTGSAGMLQVEAAGLAWLAHGGGGAPNVIGAAGDLLVLPWIEAGPAAPQRRAASARSWHGCIAAALLPSAPRRPALSATGGSEPRD